MHKGETVTVNAYVQTSYQEPCSTAVLIHRPKGNVFDASKCLWRIPIPPFQGIITGYTWRATGIYNAGNPPGRYGLDGLIEPERAALMIDKRHKVWNVQPLYDGDRYLEPYQCLEHDLTLYKPDVSEQK